MSLIVAVFLAAIANWGVVETIHHGSIFARFRAYIEARNDFWSAMIGCPFCLSHWTSVPCTVATILFVYDPATLDLHHWLTMPVLCFMATRLSNLFNDMTIGISRTPDRTDRFEEDLKALQDVGESDDTTRPPAGPAEAHTPPV